MPRLYAADAPGGMFLTYVPANIDQVRCGLCGEPYKTQEAKADHLMRMHDAIVHRMVVNYEEMYVWQQRRPSPSKSASPSSAPTSVLTARVP